MMVALRKIGVGNDSDTLLDRIKTHSDLKAASVRVFLRVFQFGLVFPLSKRQILLFFVPMRRAETELSVR